MARSTNRRKPYNQIGLKDVRPMASRDQGLSNWGKLGAALSALIVLAPFVYLAKTQNDHNVRINEYFDAQHGIQRTVENDFVTARVIVTQRLSERNGAYLLETFRTTVAGATLPGDSYEISKSALKDSFELPKGAVTRDSNGDVYVNGKKSNYKALIALFDELTRRSDAAKRDGQHYSVRAIVPSPRSGS